jgi:hypothetical protein
MERVNNNGFENPYTYTSSKGVHNLALLGHRRTFEPETKVRHEESPLLGENAVLPWAGFLTISSSCQREPDKWVYSIVLQFNHQSEI